MNVDDPITTNPIARLLLRESNMAKNTRYWIVNMNVDDADL